jgi:DNA-binding XRE family transcriptional regulator
MVLGQHKRGDLTVNTKLIQMRNEKNMTQEQMAELLNIDRSTYAHYERGRTPHLDTAIRIARILGVTVEDIFLPSNVLKQRKPTGTSGL